MFIFVYMCVGADTDECLSQPFPFAMSESGSLWTWSCPIQLDWLVSEPLLSPPQVPGSRARTIHHHLAFVYGFWGWTAVLHGCMVNT